MSRWVELGTLLLVVSCGVTPMAPAQVGTNRFTSSGHPYEREGNQAQSVIIESDKIDRIDNDRLLIFIGNVVAWQRNWRLYADRIKVYLDETDRILRATSIGNVRIATSDCQKGTGGRAEYHVLDHRVVLSGNARVSRAGNVISGEDIVIYLPRASSGVSGDCAPAGDEVTPPVTRKRRLFSFVSSLEVAAVAISISSLADIVTIRRALLRRTFRFVER